MGRGVCFQQSWLSREVDNVSVSDWCTEVPSDKFKGKCMKCPAVLGLQHLGRIFSVKEGFPAIEKHARSIKHRKNFQARAEGNLDDGDRLEQINIGNPFKNQEELNRHQNN